MAADPVEEENTENEEDDKVSFIHDETELSVEPPRTQLDVVTLSGLFIAIVLIVSALVVGGSPQAFVNPAALMIVIGGTLAVTAISYFGPDLAKVGDVLTATIFYSVRSPKKVAYSLMQLAVIARQKGILVVSQYEDEMKRLDNMAKKVNDSIISDSMRFNGRSPVKYARRFSFEERVREAIESSSSR